MGGAEMTAEFNRAALRFSGQCMFFPDDGAKNQDKGIGQAARQSGVNMPRSGAAGDHFFAARFEYFNEQGQETT
ncbi:MAG: hypothetical protein FWD77_08635 [Betaproteobacteria bacterium]|nr:hypothetical protein [Betaproteobacteria bacterium]